MADSVLPFLDRNTPAGGAPRSRYGVPTHGFAHILVVIMHPKRGRRAVFRLAGPQTTILVVLFLLAGFLANGLGGESAPARAGLLVGIQNYAHLGADEQLQGCRNDLVLMHGLLTQRFGFSERDVVVLADEAATAERIRGELANLSLRARGLADQGRTPYVVVFFSGHGSQIADQPPGDEDCDEEDGLDETLVPYDAPRRGGPEDIRDDELYRFARNVTAGSPARVWVVLDCCHSGTGLRGATRIRQLDRRAAAIPSGPAARLIRPKSLPDGVVLLTACRPSEVEPEFRDENGEAYGLLTRAMAEVLQRSPAVSEISYRALRDRVIQCYGRLGVVPCPTPQLEGSPEAISNAVLGADATSDRTEYVPVEADPLAASMVRLKAGILHGVAEGSLFELFREPGSADAGASAQRSEAWIEIERAGAVTSSGRVFAWADPNHQKKIEIGLAADFQKGLAVARYCGVGPDRLRVRVAEPGESGGQGRVLAPGDAHAEAAIRDALDEGGAPGALSAAWVDENSPCDLVLLQESGKASLLPATGTIAGASAFPGWGPFDMRAPSAGDSLRRSLERIARARRLIRVANMPAASSGAPLRLELQSVEINDASEVVKSAAWSTVSDGVPIIECGALFAFKVSYGRSAGPAVYATLLAVDPDMTIHAVLPYQSGVGLVEQQMLQPGDVRLSLPYRCTSPFGPHTAVLFVTSEPNDLHLLAQPGLPRLRSAGAGSELEALLLAPQSSQRGTSRRPRLIGLESPTWSAQVLRWEAVPESPKRP